MAKPTKPSKGGDSDDNDGGGGKSSGGGGGGSASSAAADYKKAQEKAEAEARDRARKQAKNLQGQIDASKVLISESFREALKIRFANIKLLQGQQDAILMEGYRKRVNDLRDAAKDNEKAAGDQSFLNLTNRARERTSATLQAASMGAGETDTLRSQVSAIRNFVANQADIVRSFFDTGRSINTSLKDLNIDTKTARLNNEREAYEQRDQATTDYYNRRYEGFTQLGNLLGQQSEVYGLADEGSKQKSASKEAKGAFFAGAREASKGYVNPGASSKLLNWQGAPEIEMHQNAANFANAPTNIGRKRAEGANLRSWNE